MDEWFLYLKNEAGESCTCFGARCPLRIDTEVVAIVTYTTIRKIYVESATFANTRQTRETRNKTMEHDMPDCLCTWSLDDLVPLRAFLGSRRHFRKMWDTSHPNTVGKLVGGTMPNAPSIKTPEKHSNVLRLARKLSSDMFKVLFLCLCVCVCVCVVSPGRPLLTAFSSRRSCWKPASRQ